MQRRMGKAAAGVSAVVGLAVFCASIQSQPVVQILQNGFIQANPTYPYIGHKYYYDHAPGDNDMPWLRNFAQSHGIFANVNMNRDWKDREFDMMKAIIWFTSHNMSWTADSTFPDIDRRAKTILETNENVAGVSWGCGHIAYAAIGLAQAQGIPARAISANSADLPPQADYILEMYSTRYNRWILLFQKGYGWIEHETDGPLGMRELQAYDLLNPITCQFDSRSGYWIAVNHPPLVFMPSPALASPIAPFFTEQWNSGRYQFFAYTARTDPNGTYPDCCPIGPSEQYLVSDDFYNVQSDFLGRGAQLPVVPMTDLNANYPLNNVHAEVSVSGPVVLVRLANNVSEFVRYEGRLNNGAWQPLAVVTPIGGLSYLSWTPPALPTTLSIRGVSIAGVHSPDVIIQVNPVSQRKLLPAGGESD